MGTRPAEAAGRTEIVPRGHSAGQRRGEHARRRCLSWLVWHSPGNVPVSGVAKRSSPRVRGLSAAKVASGALWILGVAGLLLSSVLWSRQHFASPPVTFLDGPVLVGEMIVTFAYASVGWLLVSARPRNPIGWLLLG